MWEAANKVTPKSFYRQHLSFPRKKKLAIKLANNLLPDNHYPSTINNDTKQRHSTSRQIMGTRPAVAGITT